MKYAKYFGLLALAAGMASAQDWRDTRHDYSRIGRMQADIARDRARLNEDIRCGRQGAAARDAADLARDQRALDAQYRDVRRDYRSGDRDDFRGYSRDWR
jgi:hypothetical protein